MDKHTGDKWLIHGTKRRKDNQLQSLGPKVTCSIQYSMIMYSCRNIQGVAHLQNQNY